MNYDNGWNNGNNNFNNNGWNQQPIAQQPQQGVTNFSYNNLPTQAPQQVLQQPVQSYNTSWNQPMQQVPQYQQPVMQQPGFQQNTPQVAVSTCVTPGIALNLIRVNIPEFPKMAPMDMELSKKYERFFGAMLTSELATNLDNTYQYNQHFICSIGTPDTFTLKIKVELLKFGANTLPSVKNVVTSSPDMPNGLIIDPQYLKSTTHFSVAFGRDGDVMSFVPKFMNTLNNYIDSLCIYINSNIKVDYINGAATVTMPEQLKVFMEAADQEFGGIRIIPMVGMGQNGQLTIMCRYELAETLTLMLKQDTRF